MPTYQYRCKECDHDFEVVQSFTDNPLEDCPECGGRLKKVYGNVGISFKGSGFYKTDSRGGKKSTKAASSSTDSSTSSSESTTSSGDKGDKKPSTPAASTSTSTSKD
jgi:putative FmdB family regulatory protein